MLNTWFASYSEIKTTKGVGFMKKTRRIICIAMVLVMMAAAGMPAFAFTENESRSVEEFFIETDLLKGDGTSYGLDKESTRLEAVIILIRLLGKEAEAQSKINEPCRFTDVPQWAAGYVNYAWEANLSKGVSDTLFGPNVKISAQQYSTLLLRALGYNDLQGDFNWQNALGKAEELDILPEDMIQAYETQKTYTKRDLTETSFCYLEAAYKGTDTTLIDQLTGSGVISDNLAEQYGLGISGWTEVATGYDGENTFRFQLSGNRLTVTGAGTDEDEAWILVQIKNAASGKEQLQEVARRDSSNEYNLSVSLAGIPAGEYYVDLYGNKEKYNYYSSIILSTIKLKKTKEGCNFMVSPAYGQNLRIHLGNLLEDQHQKMTIMTRASKQSISAITSLAQQITQGAETDYEKIKAIHDWVADNIYYDKDFLDGKTKITNITSISVLENKYAVCSGYANLTKDLINAAGIPCRQVFGFALGISTDTDWENMSERNLEPNHVWNEAYVGGRWVILDATWDSGNTYTGGKFTYGGGPEDLYFDTTLEFLSNTHKSMTEEL